MNKFERKLKDDLCECLECKEFFYQERDIELCDNCIDKFDLDELWSQHDQNKLDALDFNESKNLREHFRIHRTLIQIIGD